MKRKHKYCKITTSRWDHRNLSSFPNALLPLLIWREVSSRVFTIFTMLPNYTVFSTTCNFLVIHINAWFRVGFIWSCSVNYSIFFFKLIVRHNALHAIKKESISCCMSLWEWAARSRSSVYRKLCLSKMNIHTIWHCISKFKVL